MRNSNIEWLRFFLMLLICVWHTLVHGYGYENMSYEIIPSHRDIFILGLCVPAVDSFMLISGYFGINYSIDRFLKFVIQGLLVANFFIVVRYFFFDGKFSFYHQLLPISSGCWWFLTSYVVIMLLSPIINKGIEMIDIKQFGINLFLLFFIYSVVQYKLGMNIGGNLITMLLVYLLGRFIKKAQIVLSRTQAVVLYCFSLMILLSVMFFFFYSRDFHSIWMSLCYNNPIVILMSLSILFVSLSIQKYFFSGIGLFLGKHALLIYLSTEIIGYPLYFYWKNLMQINIMLCIISIIIISVIITIIDVPIQIANNCIRKRILICISRIYNESEITVK